MAPPKVLMPYFRDVGFGQAVMLTDFHFDLTLLSAFVESWRPETHRSLSPYRMWPTISDYAPMVIRLVGPCGTLRYIIGARRGVGLSNCWAPSPSRIPRHGRRVSPLRWFDSDSGCSTSRRMQTRTH
ncbi:hypothetical protein PIB30_089679 [Stylosanthes scabra]|uniref:Aminotransferase-like plant mobile domain-containing protein n=1 Tax=Stylosanthes scabra TaxID=79078 RepID=A0ABU6VTV8_9FABA|nr:hypothetical protein [Stylosanthes scabra]